MDETFNALCGAYIQCIQSSMMHHIDVIAISVNDSVSTGITKAEVYFDSIHKTRGLPEAKITYIDGNICVRHEDNSSKDHPIW